MQLLTIISLFIFNEYHFNTLINKNNLIYMVNVLLSCIITTNESIKIIGIESDIPIYIRENLTANSSKISRKRKIYATKKLSIVCSKNELVLFVKMKWKR